ncbi:cupin-like domain-containing protein [Sphingomonas sp. Mn802worker]|uniref:cupin-like domain-containing protein n=1 Tax=Sphingomonas sp. Mn802worker TaxID=629773 RepID=UPI00037B7317|nr:cupin-like domain-containing protein [Sphingomonas sp. Mn802worker]
MGDALRVTRAVREVEAGERLDLDALIVLNEPVIVRGYAADWPLVQAGLTSPMQAADYLRRFDAGRSVTGYVGAPAIHGRFHYDDTATAMNFAAEQMTLARFLDRVLTQTGDDAPSLYLGSTDLDTYLPDFRRENELATVGDTFARHAPLASIWIGNRTIASAHYDQSNNAAVCAVGHRRFTLFPPEQIANLYAGPLAPTPGGQVVSMVDFAAPDFTRFPRFADAVAAGQVAELAPGDVLVYPALWWHHVEALDAFNVLVNYWWNVVPAFMDTPMDTMLHAFLSLRDRPAQEKAAWRAMFDHYIFGDTAEVAAHLPAGARGPLAPMNEGMARQLRAYLLGRLNR